MADNTLQFDWIAILKWNLDYQFANDPSVFVAGDHLIYAEEGNNKYRVAPDVYVAIGRPKGHRGSYKVWEEDGIFPQVVFEVWSPSNRAEEMQKKFVFYQFHGVQEYYYIYPETPASVKIWRRAGENLIVVPDVDSGRFALAQTLGRSDKQQAAAAADVQHLFSIGPFDLVENLVA